MIKRFLIVLCFVFSCGMAYAGEQFALAVLSDIHADAFNKSAQDKFSRALKDAYALGARAAVVVGDSSDGQDADYRAVRAVVDSSPLSGAVYFAIGNHEYYRAFHDSTGAWNAETFPNGETDSIARSKFNVFRGASGGDPVYYSVKIGGAGLIFLGGEASRIGDNSNADDAVLSSAQLSWLKTELEKYSGGPVLVFLHQPFPKTVAGSFDGDRLIKQSAELKAILSARPPAAMFSGHSHYSMSLDGTYYKDDSFGFPMFNCASVWETWANGAALPGDHSEGFMVYINDGKVTVKGRDFAGKKFIPGRAYTLP